LSVLSPRYSYALHLLLVVIFFKNISMSFKPDFEINNSYIYNSIQECK
jgi:hypothetical protein